MPKPALSELGPEYQLKAQKADDSPLVIEVLRDLVTEESGKVSRHNLVRHRAFSDRIRELINKYTNPQLTFAEVIAELIAMAQEVAAEGDRGQALHPPCPRSSLRSSTR